MEIEDPEMHTDENEECEDPSMDESEKENIDPSCTHEPPSSTTATGPKPINLKLRLRNRQPGDTPGRQTRQKTGRYVADPEVPHIQADDAGVPLQPLTEANRQNIESEDVGNFLHFNDAIEKEAGTIQRDGELRNH